MRPSAAISLALLLVALAVEPSASARRASCGGKRATIVGSPRNDVLKGTKRADVIFAGKGDDVIRGRRGNDIICGGDGHDDLVGGPGNDSLDAGVGTDGLFGGDGDDLLRGSDGDGDLLVGGPGNDQLDGGPGVLDTLTLSFAPGSVNIDLAGGTASGEGSDGVTGIERVNGSDFGDTLTGSAGSEAFSGGSGDDVLVGGDGYDRFQGGPGNDRIDGGPGEDLLSLATAQSDVRVDLAAGTSTGDGSDEITGLSDLEGSAFNDALHADDGPNSIHGGEGDDTLEGRAGDDILDGGPGNNTLDAGEGNDTCVSQRAPGCEGVVVVDPLFVASINSPRHGQTLQADTFTRVHGTAYPALGPRLDGANVAIRRLTPNGCRWWDGKRDRLVRGPCHGPSWISADFASGTWSYELRGELPAGLYQLRLEVESRWDDEVRTHNAGLADFRLT